MTDAENEARRSDRAYLSDMRLLGVATLEQARARVQACRPAIERFSDVSDDIIARKPRTFA